MIRTLFFATLLAAAPIAATAKGDLISKVQEGEGRTAADMNKGDLINKVQEGAG